MFGLLTKEQSSQITNEPGMDQSPNEDPISKSTCSEYGCIIFSVSDKMSHTSLIFNRRGLDLQASCRVPSVAVMAFNLMAKNN